MRIYTMGDSAFIRVPKRDILLCIGDRAEVEQADESRRAEMVFQAIALAEYRDIEKSKGIVAH